MKNKTNEEILVDSLKDVKEIFDKHNIKFWLDRGTLLGAMGQGKIFSWDIDIDLGVMGENHGKIISILPNFKKKGFFVDRIPNKDIHYQEFAITRFGYLVDIFLYYQYDENNFIVFSHHIPHNFILGNLWILWRLLMSEKNETYIFSSQLRNKLIFKVVLFVKHCVSLFPRKLKNLFANMLKWLLTECNYSVLVRAIIPKRYLKKFRTIEFYGKKFNIPFNAEAYLEYKYGRNWRIPRRGWNRLEEDGSVRAFKNNFPPKII